MRCASPSFPLEVHELQLEFLAQFPLEVHELQLEFLAQFPLEVHELCISEFPSVLLGVHEVCISSSSPVPLEFTSRCELRLEFLPSSSPGSRFVGGGYWRHSRVVVGRSCLRSARVHERHGPAGTSSPRASDHAGGRLGVEVGSARLDDALRKVATSFIFFGVLCK